MKVEELGLFCGDALQLQMGSSQEQRFTIKLIGIKPMGSIIVTAPVSKKGKMYFVREGDSVTLRFVVKNVVSGFTSTVIQTNMNPYPYLHLGIPRVVQTVEVRKEIRVDTEINTSIINKTHNSPTFAAKMLNLSCSGCRFASKSKIALMGHLLDLTLSLVIDGIEKLVTLQSDVSYVKEDEDKGIYIYGVNFSDIEQNDGFILRAFIYQELLRGMHLL